MAKPPGLIDHLLARLRGSQTEPDLYPVAEVASRPRGFSEGGAYLPTKLIEIDDGEAAPEAAPMSTPFASIGPQGHRARMRERVLAHGAASLADYELLEMLLFFAFKKGDTKPLAKSLINRHGSFANLLAAPALALLETPSLGPHSVTALKLVQEAAHRLARAEVMDKPVLSNWDRLMAYLTTMLAREKIEQFRILFLDPRNRLIADEAQARGTVNHTPVYPREVVKRALELHATAIILVHNHPSGDPTPSRADIEMTAEIKEACGVLGVVLHDHVIIGNGAWLSFRKDGLL
jgi:DNA repair protein RadC